MDSVTTRNRSLRPAAVIYASFTGIALLATQLVPMVPPNFPVVHAPLWWLIAAVCATLAVALVAGPVVPRQFSAALAWCAVIFALIQGFVVVDLVAMFGTWMLVPALVLVTGPLKPRPRKALLAAHVVSSAMWVGVTVTFVAMATVAMTTADEDTRGVLYEVMALFDVTLLPWVNFATVLTGLALSVGTKWGLISYYWVVTKIVIAVGVLIMAFGFLHDAIENAEANPVLAGFVIAALGLVTAVLLSVYKPGGRTRFATRPTVLRATQR